MHYKSRSQDASSSDPPTIGSTVTRWLPKKIACQLTGRAGRGNSADAGRPGTRGGEHRHISQTAKTTLASQMRKRTGRGTTSAADTKTVRDPASYPLRDGPDTPTGRCCNTDPTEHHPGSGPS